MIREIKNEVRASIQEAFTCALHKNPGSFVLFLARGDSTCKKSVSFHLLRQMISRDIRDTIDTQHDTLPHFSDESRSLASAQDFKQTPKKTQAFSASRCAAFFATGYSAGIGGRLSAGVFINRQNYPKSHLLSDIIARSGHFMRLLL